ncbi:IGR protein motif-domain-containing protein [Lineolata rhizophorae]|uniref:Small ribosomal subunit protein mS41 n=1 Tax=Lineolata rhizophorae TaxID=578093 RepID=A0A6A6NY60_9PEZI|nr:IGR protein motif-domain-containing protein [Lineolata rhizophorae]
MLLRRGLPAAVVGCVVVAQIRSLHNRLPLPPVPSPTPFVPDAVTFLTVIGRNLSQHASKFPSWDALFTLSSSQLRELGVEPARSRRYLLRMRERFRRGEYGIGGDLTEVKDGVAELRLVEVPVKPNQTRRSFARATATKTPGMRKMVVNVPPGSGLPAGPLNRATPVKGVKIKYGNTICAPHIERIKGTNGLGVRITVKEGIWEQKRGHKVDGGERRKAEVRAKRRAAERKAAAA